MDKKPTYEELEQRIRELEEGKPVRNKAGEPHRENELWIHYVFDEMKGVPIQGYNRDRRVVYWNSASEAAYGYSREEAMGRRLEDLIIPETMRENVIEEIRKWHEQGIAVRSGELTLQGKNGAPVYVHSSHVMLANRFGEKEMFCIDVDLSERKKAEEALVRLNDNLEKKVAERAALAEARSKQLQALAVELIEAEERERRRIAYLLHDDLQQVLAAARFRLQIGMRNPSDASELALAKAMLEECIEKSRRLAYELSPPVLHHFGVSESLGWLADRMLEQFGLRVELETNGAEKIDASLKTFLFRSVRELLFNVVKHAETNDAKVELSVSEGDLVLSVRDEGRGFDPTSMESKKEKAGFGLSTVERRANLVGGSLSVESALGRGSRFTLKIPLNSSGGGEPKQPRSPASSGPGSLPESANKSETGLRVLFADDHKVMRRGLVRLISSNPGIETAGEAENGREAVEKARLLKPDLILMDVSMPEMDGVEATRAIKAEMPEIRVIGLSMFDDEKMAETMREAGAESFVSKTASPAELLEAIYGSGRRDRLSNSR